MKKISRLRREMIIDSNFLIDILNGKTSAVKKMEELRERKEPLLLAPGVLYELYSGTESEKEITRIENELNQAELTPAIEKEAARIRKKLTAEGKPISSIDYLIAGTARHLNEKILTRDEHFKRIEELKVEEF